MIKNMKYLFALSFLVTLISFNANAQVKKGDLVDGISAVVGDEIVLESDILEQQNYAIQQGAAQTNKCEFMEQILSNKLLIYNLCYFLLYHLLTHFSHPHHPHHPPKTYLYSTY